MPKASPSTRSSGQININFGVISIQSTLYSGTVSSHGITRNEYALGAGGEGGDARVGRGLINKETGQLLEPGDTVVKKIATEYGPVFVEDHEIEKLFSLSPDSFQIKKFQPLALFRQGVYVPKSVLFVQPRKTGSGRKKMQDPTATKLLATLLEAMRDKGAMAVGEVTTRGVPKPAVLLPDGKLWLVWHTDALREQRELPEVAVGEAEVAMMGQLIGTAWSEEELDLSDERSALIQNFADEKAQAGDFGKPEEDETKETEAAPSGDVDILAMLAASVEQAKAS